MPENLTATEVIPGWIAGTWKLDPAHSHVGFIVKHMMVSKARGHFQVVDATIVTVEDPFESKVSATIEANSITTGNETRDGHLASADFFDIENHPRWSFESTGVRLVDDEWLLDGELTIRGITQPVTIGLETPAFGLGQSEDAPRKLGVSGTTFINRSDFNVSYNGPIPGGGMALGEKVEIILDIEADQQA